MKKVIRNILYFLCGLAVLRGVYLALSFFVFENVCSDQLLAFTRGEFRLYFWYLVWLVAILYVFALFFEFAKMKDPKSMAVDLILSGFFIFLAYSAYQFVQVNCGVL